MLNQTKPTSRLASSMGRWIVFAAVGASVVVAVACGSDNTPDTPTQDASTPDGTVVDDGGTSSSDGGAEARAPRICTPPQGFDDCTGRCGPIRNPCTGVVVKQCGGCQLSGDGGAQVCDLESNTCIKPKVTCEDLGAECGRVKNSCGAYLDCPTGNPNIECSAGDPATGLAPQECDPDTKKCRTATAVTCKDLGFECGQAWLGVGPKTNLTDCGDCSGNPDKPRCNTTLKVCEPACAHPTSLAEKKAVCDAAKATRGVQCGIISDGCGGDLDCTEVGSDFQCPNGTKCGFGGIANRCDEFEPPPECIAAGQNCGTVTSACTGQKISCGTCTGSDVCNANGVCGPPCVPKKCSDLGNPQCLTSSTPIPDGCGGIVSDCPVCPGGAAACKPDPEADGGVGGKCCVPQYSCENRPSNISANACGNQLFDNGCGVLLNCGCTSGSCVNGTCCTAAACPAPGTVNDSCGATDLGCGVSCNRGCANDPQNNSNTCFNGKCCNPEPDSASEWRTANPGRCQFNIPNGCGGFIDAPCLNGAACIDVQNGPGNEITDPGGTTTSAMGYCCSNPTAGCAGNNTCQSVANACITGRNVTCGAVDCPDGADGQNDEVCAGGACCDPLACPAASPENGACGNFDRQCGRSCTRQCQPDAQGNASVCVSGTCCNPEPDNATEWRTGNPGACAYNITNGCGGRLDAPCGAGEVCQTGGVQVVKSGTTFSSGTCCKSADSCGGPKAVGEACVVANVCLNGQTVTCSCAGGATCYQSSCCQPSSCPANSALGGPCGTVDRGCGQSCNRGCSAGTCYQGTCCQASACPAPGNINEPCGSTNLGCGQSCNRGCDTSGNKQNNKCVSNVCTCVPNECPPGFTGSMQDGCGTVKQCTAG